MVRSSSGDRWMDWKGLENRALLLTAASDGLAPPAVRQEVMPEPNASICVCGCLCMTDATL